MKLKLADYNGILNTSGSNFVRFRRFQCCVLSSLDGQSVRNRTGIYSTGKEERHEWEATPGWIEGVISPADEDEIILIK